MYFSRIRIRPNVRDLHLLISGNSYGAHQLLWKLFPGDDKRTFIYREEVAKEQIPFHKGIKKEPVFYLVSGSQPISNHPIFDVESKTYTPKLVNGEHLAFKLRANPTVARKVEGRKHSSRHDVVMDAQYHLLRDLAGEMSSVSIGDKSVIKRGIVAAWRQAVNSHRVEERLKGIIAENERYSEVPIADLELSKLLDLALKARMNKALEAWFIEKCPGLGCVLVRDDVKKRLKFQAEGYQWHALPRKAKTAGFSSVDFEGELQVIDATAFSKALFNGIGPAKGFGCGLMLVRRV